MKFTALFICLYLLTLAVLPTVKALKQFSTEHCEGVNKSNCESQKNPASKCNPEKCLLNLSFNVFNCVVFTQEFSFKALFNHLKKEVGTHFYKNFHSHYNPSIWQPPD